MRQRVRHDGLKLVIFERYTIPDCLGGQIMAKHEHGSMDVTEQERTFEGFIRWSAYTLVVIAIALIFLALTQT